MFISFTWHANQLCVFSSYTIGGSLPHTSSGVLPHWILKSSQIGMPGLLYMRNSNPSPPTASFILMYFPEKIYLPGMFVYLFPKLI